MPEYFPTSDYDPIEKRVNGPRMSRWARLKKNVGRRFSEPYKGLFGHIIGDNYRAFKRNIKEVFAPEEERNEKGVPNSLFGAMGWHAVSSFQRTMGATFSAVSQLFGQGVGEFLSWKFNNVATRTAVGAWTSPVFAKDAFKEACSFVAKPFKSGWKFVSQLGEDVFDNFILGGARITVGALFGEQADSLEWQDLYEPPRPQTPWSRLSHTNPHISNREAHLDHDLYMVGKRDRRKRAIDDAVLQPPNGNSWAIPRDEMVSRMHMPNLFESGRNTEPSNVVQFPGVSRTRPAQSNVSTEGERIAA
jgi:hypothetical protein